jgi:hypothetical protein
MKYNVMAKAEEQEMYNGKEKKEYEKYEIESAVDCLIRAEEIKMNKDLFPLVEECLSKKQDAIKKISSISDLKKIANEKSMEEMEENEAMEEKRAMRALKAMKEKE